MCILHILIHKHTYAPFTTYTITICYHVRAYECEIVKRMLIWKHIILRIHSSCFFLQSSLFFLWSFMIPMIIYPSHTYTPLICSKPPSSPPFQFFLHFSIHKINKVKNGFFSEYFTNYTPFPSISSLCFLNNSLTFLPPYFFMQSPRNIPDFTPPIPNVAAAAFYRRCLML